jgi:hypothetical protein
MKFFFGLFLIVLISVTTLRAYPLKEVPPLPPPTNVINVNSAPELAAAVSRLQQGQTVVLADGEYNISNLYPIQFTKNNTTLRSASGDPTKAVIRGRGFESSTDVDEELFQIRAASVTFADITIKESRCHGVKLVPDVANNNLLFHNVHFLNIGERKIKGSASTSNIYDMNGEIRYCLFEDTKIPDENRPGAHDAGNYIAGMDMMMLDGWHIHDNVFRTIKGASGRARGAVFLWRGTRNCIVERNLFIECDKAIALWEPSSGHIVRNNFIFGGAETGMSINTGTNIKIYNNTSFANMAIYSGSIVFSNSSGCEVKNNIIYSGISAPSGDYPDTAKNILIGRIDRISAASWFTNVGNYDLHLTDKAVDAIDKGMTISGVDVDWDGNARTGTLDIGADEYEGSASLTHINLVDHSNAGLVVSPNPFSGQAVFSVQNVKCKACPVQGHGMQIAKLDIFDSSGRKVRVTRDVRRATYVWDGRDNQGNKLPNGTYLVRAQIGGQANTAKVIIHR